MGNVKIISNSKELRHQIQEEINSFNGGAQISWLISYITIKFGCDCQLSALKNKGDVKYLYCYLPDA